MYMPKFSKHYVSASLSWLDTSYSNLVSNLVQKQEEERVQSKEHIKTGFVLRMLTNINYLIVILCFQLFLYA
jgi:hypothetical protein